MDVEAVPQPGVPAPKISAPPEARDPHAVVPPPEPPVAPGSWVEKWFDRFPDIVGNFFADAAFSAVKGANNLVWGRDQSGPSQPHQPGSWKFTALGDFGGGMRPQEDVAQNILAGKPEVLVTLGDNVYYSGTEQEYEKKWDPPKLFGRIREQIPVMPSLGNHDTKISTDPYFRRFPELDKARYYSFDHKGVHFVALNTMESLAPASAQRRWLDKDLAASSSDWKVLYFHHPLNTSYPKNVNPAMGYLAPLIAKHGVDLVLTGHEHNYIRTKPFNDKGTIEVIAGAGGKSLHPFVNKKAEHIDFRDVDFGHLEVEVRDDELVGRYINRGGDVRDTFVIPNLTPGSERGEAAQTVPAATQGVASSGTK